MHGEGRKGGREGGRGRKAHLVELTPQPIPLLHEHRHDTRARRCVRAQVLAPDVLRLGVSGGLAGLGGGDDGVQPVDVGLDGEFVEEDVAVVLSRTKH